MTKSKIAISTTALCGKSGNEIAKFKNKAGVFEPDPDYVGAVEMQGAVTFQPVCLECQQRYREHPRSPFAKYVTGTPLGDTKAPVVKHKPKRRKNAGE